ncbi:MAG TPA: class II aldolase/adducin family protein [Micromonosporaceae bacterium]
MPGAPARRSRGGRGQATTDLRAELAEVGRSVVAAGLVVGSGGNLSARAPGADWFWVTVTGTWLDRLGPDQFARVHLDGRAATGSPRPTSELALHVETYRARPDVNAIVHLHPQTALLLDLLGERIRLVTTDHAFYLRRVARTGFRPPGSQVLADEAAAAVADGTNCLILARHGCSVLGPTVELAHKRALYLEEAALLTYRALTLGAVDRLTPLPDEFLANIDAGRRTAI